jgi:hypothetical protein
MELCIRDSSVQSTEKGILSRINPGLTIFRKTWFIPCSARKTKLNRPELRALNLVSGEVKLTFDPEAPYGYSAANICRRSANWLSSSL